MKRVHLMPFGATLTPTGTRFRLWAPAAQSVSLILEPGGEHPIPDSGEGWRELTIDAPAGTRYRYRIDGGLEVPDPASRHNPADVHGPSEVIDPLAYDWRDTAWRGRPWHEAVIYELHVGSFSPEGTFAGVEQRLDHLADLGVTALELMPIADFPGARNWGYDGVLPFAPDARYGRPEDLKRLIDSAHAKGLMVVLDVVYNHFGPEGNYLHAYAPDFFTERHQTPWGAAINFDGPGSRVVRDFFIHNALFWLEEYHLDGLRLDAVHAFRDDSPIHILQDLAEAVRDGPGRERQVHLVLENEHNTARYQDWGYAAQWNDDLHHAFHVLLTGEADGYYHDYADRPLWWLGRCLAEGFAFQGEPSPYRHGEPRGEPSAHLPYGHFIGFLQNHDQIGNRAFGERLTELAPEPALKAALAILLLSPQPPMLFMGEEWASRRRFPFFCDFGPELAAAVTEGRRKEFARFARFQDPAAREAIPDPNAAATFESAKLDWDSLEKPAHRDAWTYCRDLLGIRRRVLWPRLTEPAAGAEFHLPLPHVLTVRWPLAGGWRYHLLANLSDLPAEADWPPGETVFASAGARPDHLLPWSLIYRLEPPHE